MLSGIILPAVWGQVVAVSGTTSRVSVASDGTGGNGPSNFPALTPDGRYVAFASGADNLVSGDTNGAFDIFVHDRQTGETSRVSVASDGTEANGWSEAASISADGRYVAFESLADNLVGGDIFAANDIFVHDRQTGETSQVSVATDGTPANVSSSSPVISADGRYVAFASGASNLVAGDTNGYYDVFVHDRQTGETSRISVATDGTEGNADAGEPSLSADGRIVAFRAWATNLVSDDTNNAIDAFVHDRQTGETSRVSVASDGAQGNNWSGPASLSADGRTVAFASGATNLVSDDTNCGEDVFVHDRQTGETSRVSTASDGTEATWASPARAPSISADGRYVAFWSLAPNLARGDSNGVADTFLHDRQTGQTWRVSVASDGMQGNDDSYHASVSADGRTVAFWSEAGNLVGDDLNGSQDIFVRELDDVSEADWGTFLPLMRRYLPPTVFLVSRVSVGSDGGQGNDDAVYPAISADGRMVTFHATAGNLVANDRNCKADVFVHDQQTGQTSRASVASDGTEANGSSSDAAISADGRFVAFQSQASNLVPDDTNDADDVFVHDQQTGETSRVSVASDGSEAIGYSYDAAVSGDGRYVAFTSTATNLVSGEVGIWQNVFIHDRQTGETSLVSVAVGGAVPDDQSRGPSLSADGRYVAFYSNASNLVSGDTNGVSDIFVYDRQTGETGRVSVASDGTEGDDKSFAPAISADGRTVAFYSTASNLVSGDTNAYLDVFVHDRQTGETSRVSAASDGTEGDENSTYVSLSADGRYVVFLSGATNLVSGDTNGSEDLFVHDRQTGETTRVSLAYSGMEGSGNIWEISDTTISADGRYVAFPAEAGNLIPDDSNQVSDVFVLDRGP